MPLPKLTRRDFLKVSGATTAAATVGRRSWSMPVGNYGVDTTVVVMMENRSTDHFLGWYGAELAAQGSSETFDGVTAASYVDRRTGSPTEGQTLHTENWGQAGLDNHHGRCFEDPGHSISHGRNQGDPNGDGSYTMDGWLTDGSRTDEFALSFYQPEDVPVWADMVRRFTTFDRYFGSFLGNTSPNRWYQMSGQTGGHVYNDTPIPEGPDLENIGWTWPTIYDLLEANGISWKVYFGNVPNAAIWGPRVFHGLRPMAEYYADAAAGLLPQVVFIEPIYGVVPDEPLQNDDHPHADLRLGQEFLSDVARAFVLSPQFARGAMFITYDEWGGFWDHVPPPVIPDSQDDPSWPGYVPPLLDGDEGERFDGGFGQLGFRVPTVAISPWTTGGRVCHELYDHTSVLKFIGENYGVNARFLNPARIDATTSMIRAFRGWENGQLRDEDRDLDVDLLAYRAPDFVRLERTLEAQAGTCSDEGNDPSPARELLESGLLDDFPIPLPLP